MVDKEIVDSLKRISGNLENINKTLTDSKPESKPTTDADAWKNRIEPLIETVERGCKKRSQTPQKEYARAVIIIIYGVAFVGLFYEMSLVLSSIGGFAKLIPDQQEQLKFLVEQLNSYSALGIGVVAVELSLIPVVLAFPKTSINELTDYYYNGFWWRKGLAKNTVEDNKPYLKALINMKCREFDLNLSHIFHTHPELFEEKVLLQKLYD